jgi:hypothetical protein
VKHIAQVLGELRRYIAASEARDELEETDCLIGVAFDDLRRKIARKDQTGERQVKLLS